jgi:hypothetical protein
MIFFYRSGFLVAAQVTDIGEQSQGIADVADGQLFHGRISFVD